MMKREIAKQMLTKRVMWVSKANMQCERRVESEASGRGYHETRNRDKLPMQENGNNKGPMANEWEEERAMDGYL